MFENNTCKITSPHKNLVSKTQERYGLYSFRVLSEEKRIFLTKKEGEKVWHQRMGHIGTKALAVISAKMSKSIVSTTVANDDYCESCIMGKFTKHVNHKISENKVTEFLQLVKSDLFGPAQVASHGNALYFMKMIGYDDYVHMKCAE